MCFPPQRRPHVQCFIFLATRLTRPHLLPLACIGRAAARVLLSALHLHLKPYTFISGTLDHSAEMAGRSGSGPSSTPRRSRRRSIVRSPDRQPRDSLPARTSGAPRAASATPGVPTSVRTPASRPPPTTRAASATPGLPSISGAGAGVGMGPRMSVGGIRRDLRAAVGGTPLRPSSQPPEGSVGRASIRRRIPGGKAPRASRLSLDSTLGEGDILPPHFPPAPQPPSPLPEPNAGARTGADRPQTPHRTPATRTPGAPPRTPGTHRTPMTRSAIRRASESRRPFARRSTLHAGMARVESPFDLLWRLAHRKSNVFGTLLVFNSP